MFQIYNQVLKYIRDHHVEMVGLCQIKKVSLPENGRVDTMLVGFICCW